MYTSTDFSGAGATFPREEENIFSKTTGSSNNSLVIGIIDMDAFEVQIYLNQIHGVELGRQIYLTQPCILADSNTDRIIAANHLAKNKAISREDKIGSALEKCPEVKIIRKGMRYNKPENMNLRHSSWAVLDAIVKYREINNITMAVEYASNDEYYVDLTQEVARLLENPPDFTVTKEILGPKTFCEGPEVVEDSFATVIMYNQYYIRNPVKYDKQLRLVLGAIILENLRVFIYNETKFEGSGGVSSSKLLAKLACPLHKPGGVTILPPEGLARISCQIPIEKLPSLGGARGKLIRETLSEGSPMSVQDLVQVPMTKLCKNTGVGIARTMQIKRLSRGIYEAEVVEKLVKETVSVGKSNFPGLKLFMTEKIRVVLVALFSELMERLDEEKARHKRITKTICVEFNYIKFPRDIKDRGNPPVVKCCDISFDGDSKNANVPPIVKNLVLPQFIELFKGEQGVLTKFNLRITNFEPVLDE